jgi:hypothetical protein
MSAIQANCGIELTIDACLAQLTTWLKRKRVTEARSPRNSIRTSPAPQQQLLRARTPSWINLQAYGEPPPPILHRHLPFFIADEPRGFHVGQDGGQAVSKEYGVTNTRKDCAIY